MKKLNLQMFGDEAVSGKKIVYLYRIYKANPDKNAVALAFTTENSRSVSKEADITETKDGSIRTPGATEVEITATSILTKTTGEYSEHLIKELETALYDDQLIEIWEANLEQPVATKENKFYGRYFQGYLTEFEQTSNAEDFVECSLTFGINGTGVAGEVTVTEEQQAVAAYVFRENNPIE